MRVTSNSYSENLVSHFHTLAGRQLKLQDQIATGQRIQSVSDDPFTAQQVLQLRDESVANLQYQKNIGLHQEFATVDCVDHGSSPDDFSPGPAGGDARDCVCGMAGRALYVYSDEINCELHEHKLRFPGRRGFSVRPPGTCKTTRPKPV